MEPPLGFRYATLTLKFTMMLDLYTIISAEIGHTTERFTSFKKINDKYIISKVKNISV